MTISEHLEELRSRILWSLAAILAFAIVAFVFIDEVMWFLRQPVPKDVKIIQTEAYGAFFAAMKVSFFAGLVAASPIVLHQIWGFVAAGLYSHERKAVKFYAVPGFVLFLLGAYLAYGLVMPWALRFLIGFSDDMKVESFLTLNKIVSLIAWAMFVFGIVFQLPVIMVFLMRLGVVTPATFRRYRRGFVVAAFAVAMMLTPPDVISQLVLAGSMIVLYEGAILVGARIAREREKE